MQESTIKPDHSAKAGATSRIKLNHVNPVDAQRAARIKAALITEGDRLRADYPILKHQDAIGMGILLVSLAAMGAPAYASRFGMMPWHATIPLAAIFASFTHELEHDLIHSMYFRKNAFMHNLMMALVWVARPNTINPWFRRKIHLHHHKHSGMNNDIEERAITNGEKWSLKRLVMTLDTNLGVVLRLNQMPNRAVALRAISLGFIGNLPLATTFWAIWHAFTVYWGVTLAAGVVGIEVPWPHMVQEYVPLLNKVVIAFIAPNILRSFSLNFISSNMHYYGDIEDGNVVQQCQVLTHWAFIPFHLFCFNFGSTHGMHHFVVRDPFYIRQMYAKVGHQVMRENGVRFNDLGTFKRANRFETAGA